MAIVDAGRNHIAGILLGEALTDFNNANSYIGVGDSATAYAAGQTDLQAGANKFRQAMEATYPSRATNVVTFRSLMATGSANYTWAEWAIFNAAAAGTMLSRKVEALGTKTSAQAWQITATLTLTTA